jgi:RNA polymerase sigma factor (sigma-70 family)
MANSQLSEVIRHLRRTVLLRDEAERTDGQLLEDYLRHRNEGALAALVFRHGPMVWGVCRRVLRDHHDAEDAFQATFLVLVRKAASVVPREMVANWLYGVAHQTALKARATTAKQRVRERQVSEMPEPAAAEPDLWNDLQPLLDQELSCLPDKHRVAIVLCDLEGKTRKEAARQLGVPEGTLAARVARGRVMLAKRLARHGLALSGGALGTMLAQNVLLAGVPTSMVSNTIKAASLFAAGQTAVAGLISAKAAALTEGVLQTMLLSKIKLAMAVVLVVAVVGVGGNRLFLPTRVAARADEPKQVQPKKPQQPPQKDKPRIELIERFDREFKVQLLFVRDPSSGEFKPLTREDGIPVLKGHIEFQVKKLKEAKDDKSIREALKGLEESVQNMKDLLSLSGVPAEKKPEDKKPGIKKKPEDKKKEPPPAKKLSEVLEEIERSVQRGEPPPVNDHDRLLPRDAVPDSSLSERLEKANTFESDKNAERPQILVCLTDSSKGRRSMKFMTASRTDLTRTDNSSSELKAKRGWRELPPTRAKGAPSPLTTGDLSKEKLQAHHRFDRIVTREEARPIIQSWIEFDLKKLKEAKDDKSMREALGRVEHSVQMMKELLTFDPSRNKR